MTDEEKDKICKEWESENITRGEMFGLIIPLATASSAIVKSLTDVAVAFFDADGPEEKALALKISSEMKDALEMLGEVSSRFDDIYKVLDERLESSNEQG